jgi:hypothetical protein
MPCIGLFLIAHSPSYIWVIGLSHLVSENGLSTNSTILHIRPLQASYPVHIWLQLVTC